VNGVEVDPSDAGQLMTAAVTGGDSLSVTGFNLAPSPFLDCHWGGATAQPGAALRSFASPPPVCEDLRVRTSPLLIHHPLTCNALHEPGLRLKISTGMVVLL